MFKQMTRNRYNVTAVILFSVFLAVNCKKKEIIKIDHDRITEVIPGNRVSAAYMDISNMSDKDDVLLSADTEDFETVEFHNMFEEDGVMKMEPMEDVKIKAGETVKFAPGGMHIMLINNKTDVKVGDKIKLNLHFENAGLITLTSSAKSIQEQVE